MKRQRKRLRPKGFALAIKGKKNSKQNVNISHSSFIMDSPKNTSQYLIKQFSKVRKLKHVNYNKEDDIICGSILDQNNSCFDFIENISEVSTCCD
jgi:hypothetical protein